MRLHVLGFPHTQTTAPFEHCAYTARTRDFATMMTRAGFDVTLYAGESNDAEVTTHVPLCSPADQREWFPDYDPKAHVFNTFNGPGWDEWNRRAIDALSTRIEPWDVLCLTMGLAHRPVADAFPDTVLKVETGIGYEGTFAPYRVYESWAWRNYLAGKYGDKVRLFDETIPRAYDLDAFPQGDGQGGYYAFVGRLIRDKGVQIAADTCRAIGAKLVIAGQGAAKVEPGRLTCQDGTVLECDLEYVGVVEAKERADIFGGAIATFVPTLYLEPFGGVSVESQICGTPVLVTPSGGLVENVTDGGGAVCSTMAAFVQAAELVATMDRAQIAQRAAALWSFDAVAPRHVAHFERLSTLRWDGFYQGVT